MESREARAVPKDAQVIQAILKDLGIQEYENRVVNQLLDFTYRYVTTVLDDAQVFSQYAKKKAIDSEDVKLAIQLQVEKMYSNPPPRDLLLEIARKKNSQALPPIKSQSGTRLPPDRYSLISCNYRLKSSSEIRATQQLQQNLLQQQTGSSVSGQFRSGSLLSGANLTRQTIQMQTQKSSQNLSQNKPSSNPSVLPVPNAANVNNNLTAPTLTGSITNIVSTNNVQNINTNPTNDSSNQICPNTIENKATIELGHGIKRKLEDTDEGS